MTRQQKPAGRRLPPGMHDPADHPPRVGHVAYVVIRPRASAAIRRPGLLMQKRLDGTFGVLTFTVTPTTLDGTPRRLVPWQSNGLNQPCYLFSARLAIIPVDDVRGIIAAATPELIDDAVRFMRWTPEQAIALRSSRAVAAQLLAAGVA